ncbi:MAG: hypothetical protein OEY35_06475, partial [Gammaproteobacteria bacterium]|nr:hypothetical protein [Gammaproteobacteria bacterium]
MILFWLLLPVTTIQAASIVNSKHNLSVTGSGSVKADQESQICIFCHTPHNASPIAPLWNRPSSGASYTPYSSSTAIASPGQPTGASILCLSCHDGTIALGDILSKDTPITMSGGITTMPTGSGRLGTDLRDDHPISFEYTTGLASSNGELVNPSTLMGQVRLDATGQMQCTSCHNAHDNSYGKFLVMPNIASALCTTCHQKTNWSQTPHSYSSATWNGQLPDPWPTTDLTTVADNACENCHQPHSGGSTQRLLKHMNEEDNCASCHNGNVAAKNIMTLFNQASGHPITNTSGVHDPAEGAVVNSRHVECVDCHNPHQTRAGTDPVTGVLSGVRGIDINGIETNPITQDYQLCFRCHADSTGKPAALTPRQITQTNVRLEFTTTNPSFHPVAGPGQNPNVPSLIAPLTINSTISCKDCHNSNNSPTAGGNGPEGPHGSSWKPLLIRQYETLDYTTESASNYALCYGCHDRNSILGNQSFPLHNWHIVTVKATCNTCHDPHGISDTQG